MNGYVTTSCDNSFGEAGEPAQASPSMNHVKNQRNATTQIVLSTHCNIQVFSNQTGFPQHQSHPIRFLCTSYNLLNTILDTIQDMGNENSSSNRMAISAMSHMMKINKRQLLVLRDHCVCISEKGDTESGYQISRAKLLAATTTVNLVHSPDYEVLDKLLILWDKNGTDRIDPVSTS